MEALEELIKENYELENKINELEQSKQEIHTTTDGDAYTLFADKQVASKIFLTRIKITSNKTKIKQLWEMKSAIKNTKKH